jgi:RNA polymerase sigma-70 factor (ECF subfamily)
MTEAKVMTAEERKVRDAKFTVIFNEYHPLISTFLRSKVKNEIAREEIIHKSFEKILEHLESYDISKGKLNTWIYTIVNRKVIDYFREVNKDKEISKSDFVNSEGEEAFEFIGDSSANAEVENSELHRKIRKAMRNLKPIEKHIAILRFVKEFDYNEIADVLEIPQNTVKVYIMRAKEKLQESLKYEYASL